MLKKQPLSPTDVRDSKVYRDWGLTDAEYQLLTDKVLQRLPNETETGLFSACGANIAPTRIQNQS